MTTATIDAVSAKNTALLEGPGKASAPESSEIVKVAREYGVSPLKQLREMIALNLSPARLEFPEYFSNRLFDPDMTMAQKREYVGKASNWRLNQTLSPHGLVRSNRVVKNKLLYSSLLNSLGLRSTRTQALVANFPRGGAIPTFSNAADLKAFLLNDARYPLFGKPNGGSLSAGSACIVGVDGVAGTAKLADGRQVSLDALCTEMAGDHRGGFLLQDALVQHPDMAAIIGKAIGSLRIVTVTEGDIAYPLYSVWKIPSPTAMSDNFWQDGSMIGAIDLETGKVTRARTGSGLKGRDIETHPVSGKHLLGFQIPHFREALALACRAHDVFPEFGVLGFDMAITADGPAVVECNDNPFHMLYQIANQRGVRNADFNPVFARVAARAKWEFTEYRKSVKRRYKTIF
ncbi:sugar-transfer associated ATP-grasp domain-containing protein [Seohaeicola zhoushanensis]|uniref:Alpha-L-glutamate ligase-related protein ATP-grasp domain-containing protein n=1 Tax=Seohaeicola zhoushanensis TaxID=1569283 RepID=A0A8J3M6W1_9RHOB|nr:sugar-transfer associated ATP-grasp domain-containing protein [Seohaeicola zhoushanensis]GHF32987.1 hypothetical protein GCM10017056_00450 [Seohaeicola zhoushanensis]